MGGLPLLPQTAALLLSGAPDQQCSTSYLLMRKNYFPQASGRAELSMLQAAQATAERHLDMYERVSCF